MKNLSSKKFAGIAVEFLVIMMVILLSGCSNFTKTVEECINQLEAAVLASDVEGYDKVYAQLTTLMTDEKYKKIPEEKSQEFASRIDKAAKKYDGILQNKIAGNTYQYTSEAIGGAYPGFYLIDVNGKTYGSIDEDGKGGYIYNEIKETKTFVFNPDGTGITYGYLEGLGYYSLRDYNAMLNEDVDIGKGRWISRKKYIEERNGYGRTAFDKEHEWYYKDIGDKLRILRYPLPDSFAATYEEAVEKGFTEKFTWEQDISSDTIKIEYIERDDRQDTLSYNDARVCLYKLHTKHSSFFPGSNNCIESYSKLN